MNKFLIAMVFSLLLYSCGSNSPHHQVVADSLCLEIIVEDTIGVELGDENFVFGKICGVETDVDGNLLVLDAISCEVLRYTTEGIYLGQFAGPGSGPGELVDPMGFTLLSGGGVAIADWQAWGIFVYDQSFVYQGFIGPMPGGSPLSITNGPDNSITGLGLRFWNENEQPAGEYYLASWSDSVAESFRYISGPALIEASENGEVSISLPTLCFDSSFDFQVYTALSTDSTFVIRHFAPSGEEIGIFQEDWEPVLLNSVSRAAMENEDQEMSSDDYYANAIIGIHCDEIGNIWVRLGTSSYPIFNVYSSSGELVTQVHARDISDPLFELDFLIRSENIFAWNTNPVDYPKVFILNNPLSEN